MTFGKASALALALAGTFALGIWIGTGVGNGVADTDRATAIVEGPGLPDANDSAAASARRAAPKPSPVIPASAETVQAHTRTLLNRGADMTLAAEGFRDAEQFVTVAHAARNTEIPFVLLKHRVLTEGKSLAAAIRESKPDLDAAIEADRARAEARSDVARLRG